MKKISLITILILSAQILFANINRPYSDTFFLDDRAKLFLKTIIQNVDFKTCEETIIIDYINKYFEKDRYDNYNEFDKKKYIKIVRDTLNKHQGEYSLNDIYGYSSIRLLGDYDFDKTVYPIIGNYYVNGGQFSYKSYKNETQVNLEHNSKSLNLINPEKFPLYLKFSEEEAEKILNIQKQMRKEYLDSLYSTMDERTKIFTQRKGIKFKDDYGNFAEYENRTVEYLYFIKILTLEQSIKTKKKIRRFINSLVNPSGVQEVEEDPNSLKVEIVKIIVYLKGGVPNRKQKLYEFYPEYQTKVFN